jgi:cytochrome c553
MSFTKIAGVVCLLFCCNDLIAAGDPELGKAKAVVCTACHGEDGNSSNPAFPKLAGQLEEYIFKQTLDFKLGQRTDAVMYTMASAIPKEDDLKDIAAYFASQPVMQGEKDSSYQIRKGRLIYTRERCHFCHGKRGKNHLSMTTPPAIIGGQHKDYLVRSLKDIQSGVRKADIYNLMAKALDRLSHDDIEAVSEYLSRQ